MLLNFNYNGSMFNRDRIRLSFYLNILFFLEASLFLELFFHLKAFNLSKNKPLSAGRYEHAIWLKTLDLYKLLQPQIHSICYVEESTDSSKTYEALFFMGLEWYINQVLCLVFSSSFFISITKPWISFILTPFFSLIFIISFFVSYSSFKKSLIPRNWVYHVILHIKN